MNWYAVRGNEKRPVRFCHYWKDRPFVGECPVPAFLVQRFNQLKSRYATHVRVEVDDQVEVSGYTLCMPDDQAERELGRWEALLKIRGALEGLGWYLQREGGTSMCMVEYERAMRRAAKKRLAHEAMLKNREEGLKRQPAIAAARKAARGE